MTIKLPPRKAQVEDKEVRFYVTAPGTVKLALQEEAFRRGTDLWTLGGSVLALWVAAGCPDGLSGTSPVSSPTPSPTSSVAVPKDPGH